MVHVLGYKAQTPANKDQKILNIVSPRNAFLAIPGNKCQIMKLRGKNLIQTCQVYLIALCMSAVCVLDTFALSISIIQEIGNIKR